MSNYQLFEAGILSLALLASLWGALRKGAPRLSLALGEWARKAGMPASLVRHIFGEAKPCQSGCSRCGGCEHPSETGSVQLIKLSFPRKP